MINEKVKDVNCMTKQTPSFGMTKQTPSFGWKDKIGYLCGDLGNDLFFALVMYYLMVYFTDALYINPAFVGGIFLIARVWDAFADITWGRFIDSRKTTANGKFKPWIFRMSFPLVIAGVLMFVKIPGMSNGFYMAWALVTYILWGTLYSTVNIPYGSMASVITNDANERTMLSAWRTIGSNVAFLIIGAVGPMFLFTNNKIDSNHFLMGAIIVAILALASYISCYKLSTERVEIQDQQEKTSFIKTLKGITKNKPFLILILSALVLLITTMLQGAVTTYLFSAYFGNAGALSFIYTSQTVLALVAIPLLTPLARRFGKKEVSGLAMIISGVVYALLYFIPNVSLTTFIVISSIAYFANCFFQTAIWAFVTDCIDYHELVTGLREDASIYSIYSFVRKIGQAVAGGLGGFTLAAIGYNATVKVQAASTLHGIYALNTLAMGIGYIAVGLLIVCLYPLNKKRTLQLSKDLVKKRNKVS